MRRSSFLLVLAMIATACSGTSTDASDGVSGGSTAGGGDSGSGGPWLEMLSFLPDAAETRGSIVLQDFELVRQTLGLELPSSGATEDEIAEYAMNLTNGPVVDDTTQIPRRSPMVFLGINSFNGQDIYRPGYLEAWERAFGFTFLDIDREAVTGPGGRDEIILWVGSIDPGAVETAVASDPVWSDDLERLNLTGADYYCWSGAQSPERADSARRLGTGGCLAAGETAVFRTKTRDAMEAAIEARVLGLGSLAEVEELALIAGALTEAGTYAAFLSADVADFETSAAEPGPFLDRYSAVGMGPVIDDGAELLVVVFVFADDTEAGINATTLEQIIATGSSTSLRRPWSEILAVRSITTKGRAVVGVFEAGVQSRQWIMAPMTRESLLLWVSK